MVWFGLKTTQKPEASTLTFLDKSKTVTILDSFLMVIQLLCLDIAPYFMELR